MGRAVARFPRPGTQDRQHLAGLGSPRIMAASDAVRLFQHCGGWRSPLHDVPLRPEEEAVIALDARNGKTVWEYKYAAPFLKGMNMNTGPGRMRRRSWWARVYTVGVTGKLHCLDKKTGKSRCGPKGSSKNGRHVSCFGDTPTPPLHNRTR